MKERIAWVTSVLHLVTQHLQHGGQDVGVIRQPLNPLAIWEPSWGVDDQRHFEPLLIDGVVVLVASVLAEAFSMIAEDDEDGVIVQPQFLVLIDEVLHEEVLVAQAVKVAVELVDVREILATITMGDALVVVVSCTGPVLGHERLVLMLSEPLFARL